jgi:hypothetical protein
MPNPTRIEINCETGVESIIELTDAEVAELDLSGRVSSREEGRRRCTGRSQCRAKAALLEKLGITADEAKLLLA